MSDRPEFDRVALEEAAAELVTAAGRPYGWGALNEYEREAWRDCVRRVLRAYRLLAEQQQ